jgi:hypothetical protein
MPRADSNCTTGKRGAKKILHGEIRATNTGGTDKNENRYKFRLFFSFIFFNLHEILTKF